MKHCLKISGLFLALLFSTEIVNAQTDAKKINPPSDAPSGYTYDFNKVMNLITERIATPTKSNADAQAFLDANDFPAAPANKVIDANYKDQLRIWMEKNPNLIINTLKHRKDIVTQY
jgi:hypothetical protein